MKGTHNTSSLSGHELDDPTAVYDDLICHHAPHAQYLFGWVDTPMGRPCDVALPLLHDLELSAGETVERCYPTSNGWLLFGHSPSQDSVVPTSRVRRMRLSQLQPTMPRPWEYRGPLGSLEAPEND